MCRKVRSFVSDSVAGIFISRENVLLGNQGHFFMQFKRFEEEEDYGTEKNG